MDYTVASSAAGVAEALEEVGGKVVAKDAASGPIESNAHLAVASNALFSDAVVANLAASVKAGGFVLSVEDTPSKSNAAKNAGLTQILKLPAENKYVYLFKKVIFGNNFQKGNS